MLLQSPKKLLDFQTSEDGIWAFSAYSLCNYLLKVVNAYIDRYMYTYM